jgi:hypothetical protein
MNVVRYLKSTDDYVLRYSPGPLQLTGFSDSDFLGDWKTSTTGYSTTGFVFFLAGGPVSWSSQKQTFVATSSSEAELGAAVDATKELEGLRRTLTDLNINPKVLPIEVPNKALRYNGSILPHDDQKHAVNLLMDNQGAIAIAKRGCNSKRTRHFVINYAYLRDVHKKGRVNFIYTPSKHNVADIFTKNVNGPLLRSLTGGLFASASSVNNL